jgi:hypothetical protein
LIREHANEYTPCHTPRQGNCGDFTLSFLRKFCAMQEKGTTLQNIQGTQAPNF